MINENDTVATAEIKFGDNDRLGARVASMMGADRLVLLSDVDGFYSGNPRLDATARRFDVIDKITPSVNLWKEICEKQNLAVAVVLASVFLGIAIIVAASIHG